MTEPSTTPTVQVDNLNRHYRGLQALTDVSFTLQPNVITGLLGRNGAGKSTLMKIITAQEFPSSGTVRVFGQNPMENDPILRRMVFIKEGQVYPDVKVRHVIDAASWFYPNWNAELAATLVEAFELPMKRPVKKVSRGMHSAIGIVIGMAARAEITLFDEPYLGLDAVARQTFYDHLLADYVEFPRTILLSTHLIDEVSNLLEHVLMINSGQILVDAPADEIREAAVTVIGRSVKAEEFVTGKDVWRREGIGSLAQITVAGPISAAERATAREWELDLVPVSLQELMVRTSENATKSKSGARSAEHKNAANNADPKGAAA